MIVVSAGAGLSNHKTIGRLPYEVTGGGPSYALAGVWKRWCVLSGTCQTIKLSNHDSAHSSPESNASPHRLAFFAGSVRRPSLRQARQNLGTCAICCFYKRHRSVEIRRTQDPGALVQLPPSVRLGNAGRNPIRIGKTAVSQMQNNRRSLNRKRGFQATASRDCSR
jgi:hypothetical protein